MARAEFEEKEYEVAFTIELASGRGLVFSSGQVLEKVVGYDAAAHPDANHLIWSLLQVPRPKGLRLVQPLWSPGLLPPAGQLPQQPVSLLLQYKRPDHLVGAAARQWRLWNKPYFRFTRTAHQHEILRRLQRSLGPQALVRYAAPAFWRRAELEHRHMRRTVIEGSGFVSPGQLGWHTVWTYRSPGTNGRPNPGGRGVRFETFEDLNRHVVGALERIRQPTRSEIARRDSGEQLGAHLKALGDAARARNPTLRKKIEQWMKVVRAEEIVVDATTVQRVADIASITTLMSQLDGTWHIVGSLDVDAIGSPVDPSPSPDPD